MKIISRTLLILTTLMMTVNFASAGVVPSNSVIAEQQKLYNRQQLMTLVDSDQVKQQLIAMGVDGSVAKQRIANMTDAELAQFQNRIQDLPAGQGVVGVIVTVLLVIAVLDLLGVTDVYPFIRPVNR